MGVHVHKAETLGSRRLGLDQADVSFIQIREGIQGFQDGLYRGGGLDVFYYHGCNSDTSGTFGLDCESRRTPTPEGKQRDRDLNATYFCCL